MVCCYHSPEHSTADRLNCKFGSTNGGHTTVWRHMKSMNSLNVCSMNVSYSILPSCFWNSYIKALLCSQHYIYIIAVLAVQGEILSQHVFGNTVNYCSCTSQKITLILIALLVFLNPKLILVCTGLIVACAYAQYRWVGPPLQASREPLPAMGIC